MCVCVHNFLIKSFSRNELQKKNFFFFIVVDKSRRGTESKKKEKKRVEMSINIDNNSFIFFQSIRYNQRRKGKMRYIYSNCKYNFN